MKDREAIEDIRLLMTRLASKKPRGSVYIPKHLDIDPQYEALQEIENESKQLINETNHRDYD